MFCSKCGVENPDDRSLCISCSWALKGTVPAAPVADTAKTCGCAIATLVLAILSFFTCFATALPAIICAIIAMVQIGKSNGQLKGMGMAISGLVIPVVIVPIVALLLAILMPALGQVKEKAQQIVCKANMTQLSVAMVTYSYDYDNEFPTGDKWCDLLIDEADVAIPLFQCNRNSDDTAQFCYGLNKNLVGLTTDKVAADMVMLFEIEGGKNVVGGPELLYTGRHRDDGCNIAFADGHVEWILAENLDDLRWTVDQ